MVDTMPEVSRNNNNTNVLLKSIDLHRIKPTVRGHDSRSKYTFCGVLGE